MEHAADRGSPAPPCAGKPANLQAAAVMVEPGTGRVLAYFGGTTARAPTSPGCTCDDKKECGRIRRPSAGQAFLVQTLAAALQAGISLQLVLAVDAARQPGRASGNRIHDAGACPVDRASRGACTLAGATARLAQRALLRRHGQRVAGQGAGSGPRRRHRRDVDRRTSRARTCGAATDLVQVTPSKFDLGLGLGQYPVTVVDQANAMATYAAGGMRAPAHFVSQVKRADKVVYPETLPHPNAPRVLKPEQVADLDWVLSQSGRADRDRRRPQDRRRFRPSGPT